MIVKANVHVDCCAFGRINGSHCETDVVPEPQASILRAAYRPAAEKWWQSVVAEPHSLEKPTFYLGLGNASVTNVLAAGAHERTPGNITLLPNGAVGFSSPGDRMCFKVKVSDAHLSRFRNEQFTATCGHRPAVGNC